MMRFQAGEGNEREATLRADTTILMWAAVILWVCVRPLLFACQPAAAQTVANSDRQAMETSFIQGPRQLLETLGVSESELAFFSDGQPFLPAENGTLYRLLNFLPRFPLGKIYQWQRHPDDWGEVLTQSASYRGELLRVRGKLIGVTAVELPEQVAERLGMTICYRSEVRVADRPDLRAIIFAREIPDRLREMVGSSQPLDERVEASGLMMKTGPTGESPATLYLAANRLAWYPDQAESESVAHPDHVVLGRLGMDVGLLDEVVDREPLRLADRECFYQLLAAVGRAAPDRLAAAGQGSGAIQLLQDPDQHRGRFYTLIGTARRAILIQVDDLDIAERLGISRYYEIEVFDAQARIQVRRGQGDTEGVVYSSYPVVFCTCEIPDGMPLGDVIHQDVKITGAYLKLWAYPTQYLSQAPHSNQTRRPPLQLSPLLIGRTVTLIEPAADGSPIIGWAIGLGFSAVVAALWILLWRMGKSAV